MRMRKKKNLEPRLDKCKDITLEYTGEKIDFEKKFGN